MVNKAHLQWFCEQIEEMLAMKLEDWIAVGIFFGIAVIIALPDGQRINP